jgi:hypothetical protein
MEPAEEQDRAWMRTLWHAAIAAAVAALALPAAGGASGGGGVAPCSPAVRHDVLPLWMRGGFNGPAPRIPYVLGRDGAIGAILFGAPLNAPPAEHKNNKILWVPRRLSKAVAPLWIRMQKMDGTRAVGAPVRRVVASGPGLSYVDAPSAGCWRLTLTWSGRRDTLDLAYVPPTA